MDKNLCIGRSVRDLRRAASDFSREIELEGLKNPETWIPPEGQQAHSEELVDESTEEFDPDATLEESNHSAQETEEFSEHTHQESETPSESYAELYDPRKQREKSSKNKDKETTEPQNETTESSEL